jgi:hypothetical protein
MVESSARSWVTFPVCELGLLTRAIIWIAMAHYSSAFNFRLMKTLFGSGT